MLLPILIQFCLKAVNPCSPESMLFVVKKTFQAGGGGTQGEPRGNIYVHYAKGDNFMRLS